MKAADIDPAEVQARVSANCAPGQAINGVGQGGEVQCVTAGGGGGGGTVTQVNTGTGLTGGPITTTGTVSLAAPYRLPQSCTNGQVAKSNGSGTWNCAADTDTNTTYSAAANGGLALTANAFRLTPCTSGQVLKSTGATTWACAADNAGAGGPPTGPASGDLTGTYPAPTIAANAVNSAKVADNSLTGADIQNGSVGAADLATQQSQTVAPNPGNPSDPCYTQNGIFCGDSYGPDALWRNFDTSTAEGATFFKDLSGVVHLQGLVTCVRASEACISEIFYLPPGYRPAKNLIFGTDSTGTKHSKIDIYPDGAVRWFSANGDDATGYLSLSGISFRASQ